MPSIELKKYIESAQRNNTSTEAIRNQLLKSGWSASDIDEALNSDKTASFSLPPPPVPHVSLWIGFLYVILFICLYISATSLGGIVHHAVNNYIPDNIDRTNVSYSYGNVFNNYLIKAYVSAIIVSYPIFAILFLYLKKQVAERPAIKNIKTRKYLIYITLIGTFLLLVSHIISTVYGFLDGTTTMRSLAHLAVNFAIAGSIFAYLVHEVKEDRGLS